ncbi:MAG: hypothetical protein FIA97_03450 [Methylococcaceae bacterium]|nr:hypothetical protein [Methylococcaceae bacterium]
MQQFEKHKTWMILGLAALTVAGFVALRSPAGFANPTETATAVTDETTDGNCGHCISQTGSTVDCYKPTNRYTCASQATLCKTGSICQ